MRREVEKMEKEMPPVAVHMKTSTERTGNDYQALHEWLDNDPEMKAERHDVSRIYEYGIIIEEKFGKEGLEEYVRHISDDIKARFRHLKDELDASIDETLWCFGVR
jgi:hypothetical protein